MRALVVRSWKIVIQAPPDKTRYYEKINYIFDYTILYSSRVCQCTGGYDGDLWGKTGQS